MADPGSPQWWLETLSLRLSSRAAEVREFRRYYDGSHRLAFASEKFKEAFGGLFGEFADNWCGLVVDAVEERLDVAGFRFGDEAAADTDAWDEWQRNALDVESQLAHQEAICTGTAAGMCWPDVNGDPEITIEAADEMIVARSTTNRRVRLAALKSWVDEYGTERANLYLPDTLFKFERKVDATATQWGPSSTPTQSVPVLSWSDPIDEIPNPFGVVPVVEFPNRPSLTGPGRSELQSVIPIQNAINKLLADLMVTAERAAAPQRWVAGLELDEDPDTGLVKPPWRAWVDQIIQAENSDVKFGEFTAADLGNYTKAVELLVQHVASQSRTPPHYFYLSGQFPSGESIKSAETSLVAKALRKQRVFGEEWETLMRLAFKLKGDARADQVRAETIWRDAESRTESEHIDALLKQQAFNVPNVILWEKAGYSPLEIERMKAMGADPAPEPPTKPPIPAPGQLVGPDGLPLAA